MTGNTLEAVKLLAFVAAMALFAAVSPIGVNLIAFALTLGFLVCIHELGHYIWFKRAGVKVKEFAIGMGPVIASFNFGGEQWSVRALLIGGYVNPQGSDKKRTDERVEGDYWTATAWGRMKAVLAGPITNIVFAVVALTVALMMPQPELSTKIGEVYENTPAAAAGLEAGDTITAIEGVEVTTRTELAQALPADPTQPLAVTVLGADGETEVLNIIRDDQGRFGITFDQTPVGERPGMSIVEAAPTATSSLFNMIPNYFIAIKDMITGDGGEVAGPNKFGEAVVANTQSGLFGILVTLASFSMVLGVFNLLPLLPLDGGHVVTTTAEMLGKPIPDGIQKAMGMIVGLPLFGLTIIWLFWDIIEKLI